MQETKIISMNDSRSLEAACTELNDGQIIGMPTETVYGLAANALNKESVLKIYACKERPIDNPLIVHISSRTMLENIVEEIPQIAEPIMKAFWPGPLTLLFRKKSIIPDEVTCGLPFVAVRMPSHPFALSLIEKCGFPIAAPSANKSGRPSPTTANHVYNDLNGKLRIIVDGGDCKSGIESTVLDCLNEKTPIILRPGGITFEMLEPFFPPKTLLVYKKSSNNEQISKQEETPTTPGMKYKHYSPNAPVTLLTSNVNSTKIINEHLSKGLKVGYLSITDRPLPNVQNSQNYVHFFLGRNSKSVAFNLFKGLRFMDDNQVDVIFVDQVSEDDEGLAVMNRLKKAATNEI